MEDKRSAYEKYLDHLDKDARILPAVDEVVPQELLYLKMVVLTAMELDGSKGSVSFGGEYGIKEAFVNKMMQHAFRVGLERGKSMNAEELRELAQLKEARDAVRDIMGF
jgi:hypothetical protein